MCGAIPPLPNTPSWRGAQLKSTGTTLPLPVLYQQRQKLVAAYKRLTDGVACLTGFGAH
jgi:hypothetical protein